ncbi:unnamed protein product [Mesocestoides corti]|uniref:Kinesin-like protein n=2 Tax=Mesocestoides corti TaxID=53468 RepID=A0A0R3UPW1_MESCO|nr:unnamed protein product [Mesocestoides corti]
MQFCQNITGEGSQTVLHQPQESVMAQNNPNVFNSYIPQYNLTGMPGQEQLQSSLSPPRNPPVVLQQQQQSSMAQPPQPQVKCQPISRTQPKTNQQFVALVVPHNSLQATQNAQLSPSSQDSTVSKNSSPAPPPRSSTTSHIQISSAKQPPTRKSVTINLRPEFAKATMTQVSSSAEARILPVVSKLAGGLGGVHQADGSPNKQMTNCGSDPQGSHIHLDPHPHSLRTSLDSGVQTVYQPQPNLNYATPVENAYPYFGEIQTAVHPAPSMNPPISNCFNNQQIGNVLPVSNQFPNQSIPPPPYISPPVDSQPYMLPKALKELSDQNAVEEGEGAEEAVEAILKSHVAAGEPGGGDSLASKPVSTANHMKVLKTKQTVMECVMRKLLHSMKQIRDLDPAKKCKAEAEAEHRLKMVRVMQLLMLQRKNLQQQIETLTQSHCFLQQKHQALKDYSEGCVAENLELNKKYRSVLAERDNKEAQIKALMQLSCKLQKKLEGHAHTELALENTALEMKRLACDNENLKAANQQLEACFAENVKERECVTLLNTQLKLDLDRARTELANQRVRTDKISAENSNLRNQLAIAEAGSKTAAKKNAEYSQLREAYENLQFDHQRLQLLYVSETETRRDLHNQLQEVNGNIRVISRFRPPQEHDDEGDSPFEFCAMDKIFVCGKSNPATLAYRRQLGFNQPQAYTAKDEFFAFNRVFQDSASQMDIFEEIRPMIGSFVDGYNVCILAYGPTGSGKTYTMQGTKTCPGICRRAVTELFALCDPLQGIWNTDINVAMFEIHNEVIYDLLASQITPVKLCDNGSDVRLLNAEEKRATSEEETLQWIEKGYIRRKVSSTRLNSESSRSHLIIRIHLSLVSTIDSQRRTSSLVLCDLAGSESAERIDATGSLHTETGFINRSLVTLARVFEILRRKSGQCASTGLAIPYRDSKLTHLLKPCLGGQAKCVLIVTASPEMKHLDRTLKALEFAQRAMQVSLGRPIRNSRILVTAQPLRS